MNNTTELLHNAMLGACDADNAARSIKGAKESFTSTMLEAARMAGADFAGLCEAEEAKLRELSETEGKALNLTRNKADDGWLIPAGWRNAKSVILKAAALGVDLDQSFTEVRKAEKAAREAKATAEAVARGEVPAVDGLTIALENLVKVAAKLTGTGERAQLERAVDALVAQTVAHLDKVAAKAAESAKADATTEAAAAELVAAIEAPAAPTKAARRRA